MSNTKAYDDGYASFRSDRTTCPYTRPSEVSEWWAGLEQAAYEFEMDEIDEMNEVQVQEEKEVEELARWV